MKCLKSYEEDFELNSELYRNPVNLMRYYCDVVISSMEERIKVTLEY